LITKANGETHTAKVPSTPEDVSIGVLNGIATNMRRVRHRIQNQTIVSLHGTTVRNQRLYFTAKELKVGLVTTKGYKHVLQVARSFAQGQGLGGW